LNAYDVSKTNLRRSEIGIQAAALEKKMATQSIDIQKASLNASEINYKRNKILMEKGVVSAQIYEFTEEGYIKDQINLQNAYDKEKAALVKIEDAKKQVDLAHQNITTQATQIEIIRQDLKYATVRSPVNGIISKRKIQMGQMVRTGTQLFSVVQSQNIWVTANFKETQLAAFPVGKKVRMTADAYPKETFTGIVETIGGATGSKFALLPPDNATGNYVKVVQRIPVRILFEDSARARQLLRPGFSVVVTQ
jgi:membrane fusion protein (multidrug efflux system)